MPCDPPIPFSGVRADNPTSPLTGTAAMGFSQAVLLQTAGAPNLFGSLPDTILRCENYNIGVTEEHEAPDYITGRQGHTAWTKGPIKTQGNLAYPFTFTSGVGMFSAGANLVRFPTESFAIQSSSHPKISGCKINTVSLEVNAGEMIRSSAEVWGIIETLQNDFVAPNFEAGGYSSLLSISSADGDRACVTVGENFADPNGVSTIGIGELDLEQIPQWDIVQVEGPMCDMHVIGITLNIDNRLLRNYTMGDCSGASPFGLNATSITANQRRVTGTIRWQSTSAGKISQILAVGLYPLTITINRDTGTPIVLHMEHAIFDAVPPNLSPSDRIVVESQFEALASNETEWDELVITGI